MNPIDRLNAITEENPVFKFVLNNGTIEFRNKYNELHNIDDPQLLLKLTDLNIGIKMDYAIEIMISQLL